jgi:hypothetical protein
MPYRLVDALVAVQPGERAPGERAWPRTRDADPSLTAPRDYGAGCTGGGVYADGRFCATIGKVFPSW